MTAKEKHISSAFTVNSKLGKRKLDSSEERPYSGKGISTG